ncbi:pyridoxal phosphate-dependent aminotransferase [Deferribacter autotrophicus]|uniref:Pyridoxal phosphate-dependent aminotransferase n=1 Tax=Deferribacter autotrophicus TaxID=500465 RepID=A0A5A8F6K8_9BACT|nr:pyridoxal phosphate-dependent aminotransferase [Deferribacter autotrophicus]KAA0258879.1 pyridoxal phosphate-dependent aminotransferase [Deferribacter autotrophicus]
MSNFDIDPFIVMDIIRESRKFDDAIHFEVGEPDLKPSPKVIETIKEKVAESFGYTESKGILPLREKIAEFYKKKYNVKVDPDRIIVTVGTSGAFNLAFNLLIEKKEVLAFSDPTYPCYKNIAKIFKIDHLSIPVDESTNYQIVPDMLKGKKIKGLLISSPANPTGTIYDKENLKDLIAYCEKNGIYLISDEIYHGLVYENFQEYSALQFSDNAIVINGFSKYFCMPGIRAGWIILPKHLVRRGEILQQNMFISAPTISQYAGIAAFDYEYLNYVKTVYEKRRDFLYNELKEIFDIKTVPQGGFYIWVNSSRYSDDSFSLCQKILKDTRVAITPGIDFGKNKTNHYIRFAFTREINHMKIGIERLKEYLLK